MVVTLGPVKMMEAGVVVMICVEEVSIAMIDCLAI